VTKVGLESGAMRSVLLDRTKEPTPFYQQSSFVLLVSRQCFNTRALAHVRIEDHAVACVQLSCSPAPPTNQIAHYCIAQLGMQER